jgi:hypothetical protein
MEASMGPLVYSDVVTQRKGLQKIIFFKGSGNKAVATTSSLLNGCAVQADMGLHIPIALEVHLQPLFIKNKYKPRCKRLIFELLFSLV